MCRTSASRSVAPSVDSTRVETSVRSSRRSAEVLRGQLRRGGGDFDSHNEPGKTKESRRPRGGDGHRSAEWDMSTRTASSTSARAQLGRGRRATGITMGFAIGDRSTSSISIPAFHPPAYCVGLVRVTSGSLAKRSARSTFRHSSPSFAYLHGKPLRCRARGNVSRHPADAERVSRGARCGRRRAGPSRSSRSWGSAPRDQPRTSATKTNGPPALLCCFSTRPAPS